MIYKEHTADDDCLIKNKTLKVEGIVVQNIHLNITTQFDIRKIQRL